MHAASKLVLVGALVVGLVSVCFNQSAVAAGGLTVTPATLTLKLAEGQSDQTAHFTITNQYDTPLELHFAFERPLNEVATGPDPAQLVKVSNPTGTLTAKQTLLQTVIFTDTLAVQPGSQRADLVITALGTGGAQVAVHPSIRMPIVLVKEAGAISSIRLETLAGGPLRFTPPEHITTSFLNDGNMITIPRGTLRIMAPDGTLIGKGTVNTASHAVSPEGRLSLDTPITTLARTTLPGLYKIRLHYSRGGGQTEQIATKTFFYIAWWHLAVLALGAGALIRYRKQLIDMLRQTPASRSHVRHALARRGTS